MTGGQLSEKFFELYGNRNNNPVLFFSPGRVNLIGEHTDYNRGFVFPCAINFGTYLAIRKTDDEIIKLHTLNFNFSLETSLTDIKRDENGEWVNYPLGVFMEFLNKKLTLGGVELLFSGDIPNGAGLSSSASIEMVTAVALNELFQTGLSMLDMVMMSQSAENNFAGMNCGIMDQFAVGFGEKMKAIFLNCDTLEYELVPVELNDYQLVITNTNKRRELTDSKYNERRSECERAVTDISSEVRINHLSEINIDRIGIINNLIDNETIRRRAHHVISENGRVVQAVDLLKRNDLIGFGHLMNESHDSLKDDYEVTGYELDTLVYEARTLDGVIGSRMTGAGFGGCTVSLVHKAKINNFIEKLGSIYKKKTGLTADFYLPAISPGAGYLL